VHVEKILNHTIDDVAGIYDRHDYIEEKRAGLEKWGVAEGRILRGGPKARVETLATYRCRKG
jgi:hypothetical protein